MPISDNDLQVLEEWLDGEMPEEQGEALRRRMSMEPDLSAALERLRDERNLRSRLFTVLEPGEREIEIFWADLRREVRREDVWASRVRGMRKIASLAAAIAIVFMAGWISRERLTTVGSEIAVNRVNSHGAVPLRRNNDVQTAGLIGSDDPGRLQFTNAPGSTDLSRIQVDNGEKRQVYQLILREPSGKFFVIQNIDPRVLQQRFGPQFPSQMLPAPRSQSQPQGQGVLVNEVRP